MKLIQNLIILTVFFSDGLIFSSSSFNATFLACLPFPGRWYSTVTVMFSTFTATIFPFLISPGIVYVNDSIENMNYRKSTLTSRSREWNLTAYSQKFDVDMSHFWVVFDNSRFIKFIDDSFVTVGLIRIRTSAPTAPDFRWFRKFQRLHLYTTKSTPNICVFRKVFPK